MRVTARLILFALLVAGLAGSPAGATPRKHPAKAAQPSPTPTPSSSPTPASSPASGPSPSPTPKDPAGQPSLSITSRSSELLVETGTGFEYFVTVRNNSSKALEDVVVVNEVAPEVDVVSVPLSDDALSIELGRSASREDIVWNVGTMDPAEEITFRWNAVAVAAGDLAAVNEVTVQADGVPRGTARSTTFLGREEGIRASNPAPEPVFKKVVVLGTRFVREAVSATGSLLPITGMDLAPYLGAGLALIAAGLLISFLSTRVESRRVAVGVIVMTLLVGACVTSTSDDQAAGVPTIRPTEDAGEAEKPKDEVKGKRIFNDTGDLSGDGELGPEGELIEETLDTEEPALVPETYQRVETVRVPLDEMPSQMLASRDGDNQMSYDWDLDARAIVQAASSVTYVAGATSELLTSLSVVGDAIEVVVTLRNLGEERLEVRGRLIHVVSGADGEIATFESDPIDVVLNPGGEVHAEFSYLLPTGSYMATSAFRAS